MPTTRRLGPARARPIRRQVCHRTVASGVDPCLEDVEMGRRVRRRHADEFEAEVAGLVLDGGGQRNAVHAF